MNKPTDNPADPFKKALAEATKVMADDPELAVSFTVDPPGVTADTLRLPQVSRRMTRAEVLLARGTADATGLAATSITIYRLHSPLCAARRSGAWDLRGNGTCPLRGSWGARDARHFGQYRRQNRRRI